MIKKLSALLCGMLLMGNFGYAQHEQCGTQELMNAYLAAHPEAVEALKIYEQDIQNRTAVLEKQKATSASKTTASLINVPIVYHVVLSAAQISEIGGVAGIFKRAESQIQVLNRDFNGNNLDTVPTIFQPLKGSAGFNFAIVHTGPNGKGTSGIEIREAPTTFAGFATGDGNLKSMTGGGLDPWDNSKYLNVWITDITTSGGGEVLGYAYSPTYAKNVVFDANQMGVVIDYKAFGRRQGPFEVYFPNADSGRTMVHEMGHYFTLWHIWGNTSVGSGNCNDDDGVNDTPPQKDANQTTCPSFPKNNCNSTPGGEMFMNYMDYVTDVCMRMFSKGQVSRMQSEFSGSGGSYSLQWSGYLMTYPTGVSSVEVSNSFDIMPNPTNGQVNIVFNAEAAKLKSIMVISPMGQIIKSINHDNNTANSVSVDLSAFAKGIYTVKCVFENGIVTKNVVLQ